jgi:hypothetical protein
MTTGLLAWGAVALVFAGYSYLGRLCVSRGYRAGESGSMFTVAWPAFIPLAPWFLGAGVCLVAAAAVAALI